MSLTGYSQAADIKQGVKECRALDNDTSKYNGTERQRWHEGYSVGMKLARHVETIQGLTNCMNSLYSIRGDINFNSANDADTDNDLKYNAGMIVAFDDELNIRKARH